MHFLPRHPGDQTGLVILGKSDTALILQQEKDGISIRQEIRSADGVVSTSEEKPLLSRLAAANVYLRATMIADATAQFSFSLDGETFHPVGKPVAVVAGIWIGARIGIYAAGIHPTGEFGYADYDWFRFSK
jgi:hypothetical protein